MQSTEEERNLLPIDLDEQGTRVHQIIKVDVIEMHGEFTLMPPRLSEAADPMKALQIHGRKLASPFGPATSGHIR